MDVDLGELQELVMSREAQSGRRLLGTNGGSLWLWCCLAQPGALGSAFPLGWPWEAQSSPRVARESWGWRTDLVQRNRKNSTQQGEDTAQRVSSSHGGWWLLNRKCKWYGELYQSGSDQQHEIHSKL